MGCGEVGIGKTGRETAPDCERPMGTATCGGKELNQQTRARARGQEALPASDSNPRRRHDTPSPSLWTPPPSLPPTSSSYAGAQQEMMRHLRGPWSLVVLLHVDAGTILRVTIAKPSLTPCPDRTPPLPRLPFF